MFTVLVKKPNGSEVLYACDSVEKEPNAILLRGDGLGSGDCKGLEILGPLGQTMAWDWDHQSFIPDPLSPKAQVFVMNINGTTVARYSLSGESVKLSKDKERLKFFSANDTKNALWSFDPDFILFGETTNVLDLSRDYTKLFHAVDRTALVDSGWQLRSLMFSIGTSNGIRYFSVDINPIFHSKQNRADKDGKTEWSFETGGGTVSSWNPPIRYFDDQYAELSEPFLEPSDKLEFSINITLNLWTGEITSSGELKPCLVDMNLVAYSLDLYADK